MVREKIMEKYYYVAAKRLISRAKRKKWKSLTEVEAEKMLNAYSMPCVSGRVAKNKKDAKRIADKLGYPVVMKIVSPQIVHKTNAGGVFTNVSEDEVEKIYDAIIKNIKSYNKEAKIHGVLVQNMAKHGTEVIVGMKRDEQFGPAIAFGLGGIFVEILKDVSIRIAPLSERDVDEMIKEIRGYEILKGVRGKKPRDIGTLKDIILKVSRLSLDFPEIKELDLNPIFLYHRGAKIVDARIIL